MAILEFHDVAAGYGSRRAIDGVSLSVDAGQVVALIGRNGSGKTTVLRAAAGILACKAGRVAVDGRDLSTLSAREAASVVCGVPQEESIDLPFRVREVVAMGRHARLSVWRGPNADDLRAVDDALRATDLETLADRRATELSGGERRRLSLARCLAQGAPVMLLDEPTAHLDVGQEARWLETVRSLATSLRRAVLVALHDVALAAAAADRVVMLDDGQVVAQGAPADVLTSDRLSSLFRTPLRVVNDPVDGRPLVVAKPSR